MTDGPPTNDTPGLVLRGTALRYVLIRLLQLNGPSSITQLIDGLERWGFAVEGRASKTISDALRWERRRDRVRHRDWGVYNVGGMPRSTEHRIIWRVVALREQAAALREPAAGLSLGGGQSDCWWDPETDEADGDDETPEATGSPAPSD